MVEIDGAQPYRWDVFISHASEDKVSFVRPLAEHLSARGLQVWYDEFTLRLGDPIRQTIDEGLLNSRFCVVILSKHFFEKNWPQGELEGILARQSEAGQKVILPVLHGLSAEEIRKKSPILAGLQSISSEEEIDTVVTKIIDVIKIERSTVRKDYDLTAENAKRAQLSELKPVSLEIPLTDFPITSEARTLFDLIADGPESGFATVDLGDGRNWLTSRLFIFALMLKRMRKIRQFVFLETKSGVGRRFFGTAPPDKVRWALAMKFPWLEGAFAHAYSKLTSADYRNAINISTQSGALELCDADQLVIYFLNEIQRNILPGEDDFNWVDLRNQQLWERAEWLDSLRLKEILGSSLENFMLIESQDTIPRQRILRVLKTEGQFIALVDEEYQFISLIDRIALLEMMTDLKDLSNNIQ